MPHLRQVVPVTFRRGWLLHMTQRILVLLRALPLGVLEGVRFSLLRPLRTPGVRWGVVVVQDILQDCLVLCKLSKWQLACVMMSSTVSPLPICLTVVLDRMYHCSARLLAEGTEL